MNQAIDLVQSNHTLEAMHAATQWYVQLTSGEATDTDYQAWQAWKSAKPEHERAWQSVEAVTQPFTTIDRSLGLAALDNANKPGSASRGRRQALKHLAVFFAIGTSGLLAYRQKPWQELLADYSTQVGESREVLLQDGTRMVLNTDSMVAINFSATHRIITLYKGEVLIDTGHEEPAHYRPFIVKSEEGAVTALGTRFSTRQHTGYTSVNLYEGALDIAPRLAAPPALRLAAGESIRFSKTAALQKSAVAAGADAWATGFLIVDKMPLADFLAELSRYKSGTLRCDPEIANLLISGAYPVHDIEAALHSITRRLPIRIERFTRYWTTVKPA
jgi:transmembrane sensor